MKRKKVEKIDLVFTNLYGRIRNNSMELAYRTRQLTKRAEEFKLADKKNIKERARVLERLESLNESIDDLFKALREEN